MSGEGEEKSPQQIAFEKTIGGSTGQPRSIKARTGPADFQPPAQLHTPDHCKPPKTNLSMGMSQAQPSSCCAGQATDPLPAGKKLEQKEFPNLTPAKHDAAGNTGEELSKEDLKAHKAELKAMQARNDSVLFITSKQCLLQSGSFALMPLYIVEGNFQLLRLFWCGCSKSAATCCLRVVCTTGFTPLPAYCHSGIICLMAQGGDAKHGGASSQPVKHMDAVKGMGNIVRLLSP